MPEPSARSNIGVAKHPMEDAVPGVCPRCEQPIARTLAEPIDINCPPQSWKGFAILCPNCRAVLSVAFDPFALEARLRQNLAARRA